MPSLTDPVSENAKILLIGDQGNGKTGAKAALVAIGYALRMIDTDKGFKILRALLTDEEHYPYASYMKKHGIVPDVSYIPIEVPMDFMEVGVKRGNSTITWDILGPSSSSAWKNVVALLREWKDGDNNYGPITDWDNKTILDFDTMSTLAEIAKYWVQDLNGHLGALTDEHGRDTGGAQEMIVRLISKVMNPSVHCNVIITGHIKRVDMSAGVPQSVEQRLREKKSIEPQGFPAIIGQALSPYVGKKFNDQFIVKRDGNGRNASRKIYTVPNENTDAKNSVWLEEDYPIDTGLASIFAAQQYQEPPHDFLEHVKKFNERRNPNGNQTSSTPRGFGQT